MPNEATQSIRKWIIIWLWLMVVLISAITVMGYTKPEMMFATWKALNAPEPTSIAGPLGFHLAQNIATISIAVFAVLNRSNAAVRLALLLRGLTDLVDFFDMGVVTGNIGDGAVALIMTAISFGGIYPMRKLPA